MASYVVAASFFIVSTSYLIHFVIEPPGSGTANLDHAALRSQAAVAMDVLLRTPGVPADWTSGELAGVTRLGLIEHGASVRVDAAKFEALARGKYATTDLENGAIDYGEAKQMLGLEGYDFHLRAYPLLRADAGADYGVSGMEDFDVAYVGSIDNGGWSVAAQYEADALRVLPISFTNATRVTDPAGDVFWDDSTQLRQHLLPTLGAMIQQEVLSNGAGTKYDFYRVDDSVYEDHVPLNTEDETTAMALSSDGTTLGYSKNREIRAIVGTANLTGAMGGTLATIEWSEWVDTDRGSGTTDCGDYGYVEVSGDGGTTWVRLTDTASARSQDCAPLYAGLPLLKDRSATITAAACAACVNKAGVLVAFHWVADNDNSIGHGWVVDDVVVTRSDSSVTLRKSFEAPEYDMLVLGSNVDHEALTPEEVKSAIRDYVNVYGGRLVVLGGQSNVKWIERLFDAGVGGSSGGVADPDETHPLLTVPNELAYTAYQPAGVWDLSSGDHAGLFITVRGEDAYRSHLSVSRQGAWSGGGAAEGAVVLTSYRPGEWGKDETRKFFANTLVYGKYNYLYLDVGPAVPEGQAVASATRTATMSMERSGAGAHIEIVFTLYVWPGASVESTLASSTVNALPPRAVSAEATDRELWVNWTAPASAGTGTPLKYEVWRGNGPNSVLTRVKEIPTSAFNGTFHDHNVSNGTAYWYNVTLVTTRDGVDARGSPSAAVGAVPIGYPTAPVGVVATGLPTTVRVDWSSPGWTGPGSIFGYAVWGRPSVEPTFTLLAELGNVTTYTHAPPDATPWVYKVSALNARGWGPNSSATAPAAVTLPASDPGLTVSNATAHQLVLSWTPPTMGAAGVLRYVIDRSLDGATWTRFHETPDANQLTHADGTIDDNATYWYRVAADTAAGMGAWSAPVEARSLGAPWKVGALTRTASVNGVSMSFTWPVPNDGGSAITGYDVLRGTDPASMALLDATATNSYTDLAVGTGSYYYQVRAKNAVGDGLASDPMQLPMTASAPTLTVTNLTGDALVAAWTAPADFGYDTPSPATYRLERSDDGGATWTQLPAANTLLTDLSYTDEDVERNTTYTYRVRAVTAAGDGEPATASKRTLGVPWMVQGLARTGGVQGVSVTMSWEAANGAGLPVTNYTVCWGDAAGAETSCTGAVVGTSYTHATSGLHWYVVRASNALGTGPSSDPVLAKSAPAAPEVSLTNATPARIGLSWEAPSMGGGTFESYTIHRSLDGVTWSTLATSTSQNRTWADLNVSANTTYWYRVAEANEAGQGANSTTAHATTIGPAWPPSVTVTNATIGALTVTWSAPNLGGGSFQSYRIERSLDGASWAELVNTSTTSTNRTWIDRTVAANTTYHYRVTAFTNAGEGAPSSPALERALGAPWTVTGLARTGGVGGVSVTLSWNAANDAGSPVTNYTICWGTAPGVVTDCSHTVVTTSYLHATSQVYWYSVRATNALGTGPASDWVEAKNVPGAPSLTLSNTTAGRIRLTWTAPDMGGGTFQSYTIYRSLDGSTWSALATSTVANRSWNDDVLPANTTFHYRVAERNEVGAGPNSTDRSLRTMTYAWPPELSVDNATVGRLVLNWSLPNNGGSTITSYKIERSTDNATWSTLVDSAGAVANRTWIDATVASNTTYHYRVRAVTAAGDGVASAPAARQTLGAPWQVTNLVRSAAIPGVSVSLTWNVPNDGGSPILSYEVHRGATTTEMTFLAATATPSYTDATNGGVNYWYKVRAVNAVGQGAWSAAVQMSAS